MVALVPKSLVIFSWAFRAIGASGFLHICPKATPSIVVARPDVMKRYQTSQVSSLGTDVEIDFETRFYEHDGWKLSYEYKPATKGYENDTPMMLIHPVGIGLASWFWGPFMRTWRGPALYAVNLIGCGIKNGSDPWIPEERDLSLPLSWVEGCEALLDQVILPSHQKKTGGFFGQLRDGECIVMVQGELAPVGVQLTAMRKEVCRLILTSPPSYKEMTNPIPESELMYNYNFLRSKVLGGVAFNLLESRWAVRFFSNLFLFSEDCDAEWLDLAEAEASVAARPPVQAFNAGMCMYRSYAEELTSIEQPVLVLQGLDDNSRARDRLEYQKKMKNCTIQTIGGKNVLPWESATEVCATITTYR